MLSASHVSAVGSLQRDKTPSLVKKCKMLQHACLLVDSYAINLLTRSNVNNWQQSLRIHSFCGITLITFFEMKLILR